VAQHDNSVFLSEAKDLLYRPQSFSNQPQRFGLHRGFALYKINRLGLLF
jgi:hypothetical protein